VASFGSRLKHAWNVFTNQEPIQTEEASYAGPLSYGPRPDRPRLRVTNERSIISSVFTRIAIDFAQTEFKHVRLDDEGRFKETIQSGLHECLTLEANLDQGAGAFRRDMAMTLFDKGVIAIVPVDTTLNPNVTGGYDINTMRIGEIVGWFPKKVRVSLWNEALGRRDEVILDKKFVAIVENPLYPVMNEPNSTLQRLIRKLNLLDAVDEQSGSGKLDLIIQLPYVIKTDAKRAQAEQRRTDIEYQLKDSKYGIAYTDGTEKITQLNRPAENNLLEQVKYLTEMLYAQLGLTPEVMNGTADEAAMLNYTHRTIVPILDAVKEAMLRTFLTKTARTQGQSIMYYNDPFKFVPLSQIAEIADKLSRNEIVTSNEIRGVIGFKPAKDKGADKLQNSNMPKEQANTQPQDPMTAPAVETTPKGDSQNGS
jgi:Phage portal protein